ncbi:MAG: hypothetical protein JWP89_896 [Schlesneria sp.]|nr:hypothetical protein [Schlesneria sp.]
MGSLRPLPWSTPSVISDIRSATSPGGGFDRVERLSVAKWCGVRRLNVQWKSFVLIERESNRQHVLDGWSACDSDWGRMLQRINEFKFIDASDSRIIVTTI